MCYILLFEQNTFVRESFTACQGSKMDDEKGWSFVWKLGFSTKSAKTMYAWRLCSQGDEEPVSTHYLYAFKLLYLSLRA